MEQKLTNVTQHKTLSPNKTMLQQPQTQLITTTSAYGQEYHNINLLADVASGPSLMNHQQQNPRQHQHISSMLKYPNINQSLPSGSSGQQIFVQNHTNNLNSYSILRQVSPAASNNELELKSLEHPQTKPHHEKQNSNFHQNFLSALGQVMSDSKEHKSPPPYPYNEVYQQQSPQHQQSAINYSMNAQQQTGALNLVSYDDTSMQHSNYQQKQMNNNNNEYETSISNKQTLDDLLRATQISNQIGSAVQIQHPQYSNHPPPQHGHQNSLISLCEAANTVENPASKQPNDGDLTELKINEDELPTKISPMSTTHNPFISSVSSTSPQKRDMVPSSVSWHPSTTIERPSSQINLNLSQYKFDEERDQMMEEATKVVEPGKVLPDRMMGGTPTGGHGFFPSTTTNLGRRRHKSEGTHLRQNRKSYFDEELNVGEGCPVVGSNLDPNDEAELGFQATSPPSNIIGLNHDPNGTQQTSDSLQQHLQQTDSVFSSPTHNDQMHFQPIQQPNETFPSQNMPQNLSVALNNHSNHHLNASSNVSGASTNSQLNENRLMKPPAQPCAYNRLRLNNNRRQRRHSADNRLFNLSSRQQHLFTTSKSFKSGKTEADGSRVRNRPPPLHIPSSVSNLSGGSRMYCSNLHQRIRKPSGDSVMSIEPPPYTPPPMISPNRPGSGLFCQTPGTPYNKKMLRQLSGTDSIPPSIAEEDEQKESAANEAIRSRHTTGETIRSRHNTGETSDEEYSTRSDEPKINLGKRFQAVVPDISTLKARPAKADYRTDVDQLCFKLPDNFNLNNKKDVKKLDDLEKMSTLHCKFGSNNKELVYRCLHLCKGNIKQTTKMLTRGQIELSEDSSLNKEAVLSADSDNENSEKRRKLKRKRAVTKKVVHKISMATNRWKPEEIKVYDEAIGSLENDAINKDFIDIASLIENRSAQEVVKRYYVHTKRYRGPKKIAKRKEEQNDNIMFSYQQQLEQIQQTSSTQQEVEHQYSTIDQQQLMMDPSQQQQIYNPQLYAHQPVNPRIGDIRARIYTHSSSPSISPSGSPHTANNNQNNRFTCEKCGKVFSKVKSKNAHMKVHGKAAEEKRLQKQQEERNRNMMYQQQQMQMPSHQFKQQYRYMDSNNS